MALVRQLRGVDAVTRILSYIEVAEDGCWLWQRRVTHDGYPLATVDGREMVAHRALFERLVAPIPEAHELDHLCRVRRCVNPDHLEPVLHAVNIRRGERATKTHCIRGHEFTVENTRLDTRGHRVCRACVRLQNEAKRKWAPRMPDRKYTHSMLASFDDEGWAMLEGLATEKRWPKTEVLRWLVTREQFPDKWLAGPDPSPGNVSTAPSRPAGTPRSPGRSAPAASPTPGTSGVSSVREVEPNFRKP